MKIFLRLIMLFSVIVMITSCDVLNSASDGDGDDNTVSDGEITDEELAPLKYLGVMYNTETGQELNDNALTGEMFDKYRDKVQAIVNKNCSFPLLEESGVESQWYESFPDSENTVSSNIKSNFSITKAEEETEDKDSAFARKAKNIYHYIKDKKDALDKRLDKLYKEGEDLQNIADNLEFLTGPVADAVIDSIAGEWADDIKNGIDTQYMFIQNVAAAATGNYMPLVNMYASYINTATGHASKDTKEDAQFKYMVAQFQAIRLQLEEIQESLDRIEGKMDFLVELSVDAAFEDIYDAQDKIAAVYNQLAYINFDDEGSKEYLYNLLIISDEYEQVMKSAWNTIQNRVDILEGANPDALGRVEVPVTYKKQIYINNNWVTLDLYGITFIYNILAKNIPHYTKILLQDIALMKRFSETRLSLAEQIYTGDDLLKYRAKVAKSDLEEILQPIKEILNDSQIKSDVGTEFFGNNLFIQFDDMQVNIENMNVLSISPRTNSNATKMRHAIIIDGEIAYQYVVNGHDGVSIVEYEITSVDPLSDFNTVNELIDKFAELSNESAFTHCHNDYFVSALSMIAEWEIKLNAHILAGEGL